LTKPHLVAIIKPKRLRQTGPHGWGSLNAGVLRRMSGHRLDRGKQSHQVGERPAVEFLNRRDNPLAQLGVSMGLAEPVKFFHNALPGHRVRKAALKASFSCTNWRSSFMRIVT